MILSFGVHKSFWGVAMMTAYYLNKMTHFTILNGGTLYKKWYDIKAYHFV